LLVLANQNFGFTPEQTLNMGWTLLQNMLEEYNSLMNGDKKQEDASLGELSKIPGVKIG